MLKKYVATALLTMVGMVGFSGAYAQNFDASQKKAIEKIIHEYLIENPEVLIEATQALQDMQRQEMMQEAEVAIKQNSEALFNANSPVAGNPKGDVVIVEFSDYQCPHCKKMVPVIQSLIEKDANLKVIYKELPIFGDVSEYASRAALAAAEQSKYLPFRYGLMGVEDRELSKQKILDIAKQAGVNVKQLNGVIDDNKISAEIENNMQLAYALRIMGTPVFIVASNIGQEDMKVFFVPGATSEETLSEMIDQARG